MQPRKSKENTPCPSPKGKKVCLPTHLPHCLAAKGTQHCHATQHFDNSLMKSCVITKNDKSNPGRYAKAIVYTGKAWQTLTFPCVLPSPNGR